MAFGFGPGADMMRAYQENRSQMRKGQSLKTINDIYSKKKPVTKVFTSLNFNTPEGVLCPGCKTPQKEEVDFCLTCSFPFSGSDSDKSKFIGQLILKKGKIKDALDMIQRVRILLWMIGIFNIVFPLIFLRSESDFTFVFALYLLWGGFFIGFGFLTYTNPFAAITLPLAILILFNLFSGIYDPALIFRGFIWKVSILTVLIYSLIIVGIAGSIMKKNHFLKM